MLAFLDAFEIQTRSPLEPDLDCSGISPIPSKNEDVSTHGIEKANDVSWEIGENGFRVDGRDNIEEFSGTGIASVDGAVLGDVCDKEFGNTRVTSARWFSVLLGVSHDHR